MESDAYEVVINFILDVLAIVFGIQISDWIHSLRKNKDESRDKPPSL